MSKNNTNEYNLDEGKCAGCNKLIDKSEIDKAPISNLKRYHPQCFSNDLTCSKCSRIIISSQEYKVALKKTYHKSCFTCILCSQNLANVEYFEINGCPCCKNCKFQIDKNPNIAVDHGISNMVITNDEKTKELNDMKKDLFNNLQKGKEICTYCKNNINLGDAVTLNGNVFHSDCFKCSQCSKSIGNDSFVSNKNDGSPICKSCSDKSKQSVICNTCKKPIDSSFTKVGENKYHPTCFVCHQCKGGLEKGYIEKEGNPLCGKCGSAQQPARTFTYSNSKQGARPNGRW